MIVYVVSTDVKIIKSNNITRRIATILAFIKPTSINDHYKVLNEDCAKYSVQNFEVFFLKIAESRKLELSQKNLSI